VSGEIFVDWLTAVEHHPGGGLPIIVGGLTVWHDRYGHPVCERASPTTVAGSFDSAIRVGCDGSRVFLSGNVGRFARADNLFNFGWAGTVRAANRVLLGIGLPPFSSVDGLSPEGFRLGARLRRVDLTANFCTGSEAQARALIRWLAAQSVARMKRGQAGEESVWWANTRSMFKAYMKGPEMVKHGRSPDEFAVKWCGENGVVRVEVELKRRLLKDLGLDHFAVIDDATLTRLFEERTNVLRRVDRSDEPDVLAAIPCRSRPYAAAWLAGKDMRLMACERTLFRHARVLRQYGLDILQPRNVEAFPVRVRVIDLVPVGVPDWYVEQLESA